MPGPTNPQSPAPGPSWERQVGDALQRRVSGLRDSPLDLDAVKGTAHRIRTRRRAALAGGVLAAVAVVVPIAVVAGDAVGGSQSLQPAGPTGPTSLATDPSTDPSTRPTPVTSGGLAYLETGRAAPVLHAADGSTTTLPAAGYTDAVAWGDDTVAAYRPRPNDGTLGFVDLVEGGQVATTYDVRSVMATAPDGRTVAFVTTDDELLFVNADLGEQSFGPVERGVTLSRIVGDGDCGLESGCHPFLEYVDTEEGDAFDINYEGPSTAPAPGALRVTDADDDFLVSVVTSLDYTQPGSCGGLYDREGGGAWVFETCDHQVGEISPDGAHTIGLPTYFDGLGPGRLSLLDDTGEEVASLDALIGDVAWIDDDTAVAAAFRDDRWEIVSLDTDGSLEVLVEGAAGDASVPPYRISGRSQR